MIQGLQNIVMTREQKMGAIFLLVFGFMAVGLGLLQIRNTLYGPFIVRVPKLSDTNALFADDRVRLQQIDTDHDGLNDYEELEFYSTSPYLPDTDSDGINDKSEIESGTDPLCGTGDKCATGTESSNGSQLNLQTSVAKDAGAFADTLNEGLSRGTPNSIFDKEQLSQIANNPQALRELLLSSGQLSADELKKIDDDTLLSIAQRLLNAQGGISTSTSQ